MKQIISTIFSLASGYISNVKEKQQAKHEVRMSVLKNKSKLALDKQQYNHEWEMANLEDKDKALRIISFTMFSAPFVVAMFAPQQVAVYFTESISTVPVWWQKTYVAITGGVWGIASLKNAAPAIVNGVMNAAKKYTNLPDIEVKNK